MQMWQLKPYVVVPMYYFGSCLIFKLTQVERLFNKLTTTCKVAVAHRKLRLSDIKKIATQDT